MLEAWEYLSDLYSATTGYTHNLIKSLPDESSLFGKVEAAHHSFISIPNSTEAALLYNDSNSSIYEQLLSLIPSTERDSIHEIIVASPFFDYNGALLSKISNDFIKGNGIMNVITSLGNGDDVSRNIRLPFAMPKKTNIRFFIRATDKDGNIRYSHAKIFLFKGKEYNYCLLGSANAGLAAFGLDPNFSNKEFSVLYKANISERDFVKELSLHPGEQISWEEIRNSRKQIEDTQMPSLRQIRLLSAEYLTGQLIVSLHGILTNGDISLGVYNNIDELLAKLPINTAILEGDIIKVTTHIDDKACFVRVIDGNDNPISNSVVIKKRAKLDATWPSKENRALSQIKLELENTGYNMYHIVEYMANIYSDLGEREFVGNRKTGSSSNIQGRPDKKVEYNPAQHEINRESEQYRSAQSSSTEAVLESFSQAISRRTNLLREQIADEEDTESSTSTHYVQTDVDVRYVQGKSDQQKTLALVRSILIKYEKLLTQRLANLKSEPLTKKDLEYHYLTLYLLLIFGWLQPFDMLNETELKTHRNRLTSGLVKITNNFAYLCARNGKISNGEKVRHLISNILAITFINAYMSLIGKETEYPYRIQILAQPVINIHGVASDDTEISSEAIQQYTTELYEAIVTNSNSVGFRPHSITSFVRELNKFITDQKYIYREGNGYYTPRSFNVFQTRWKIRA